MPKNFTQESIRHHLLRSIEKNQGHATKGVGETWKEVARTLEIIRNGDDSLTVRWEKPKPGTLVVDPKKFTLYKRGDIPGASPIKSNEDSFQLDNIAAADKIVEQISNFLGFESSHAEDGRLHREEAFHDEWALDTKPEDVLVRQSFEACTAPEHRFILKLLGNLQGKRLLDLGSGLGEASVYFALQGARVTACDLSGGMLQMVSRVATHHGVTVTLHQAPAEKTGLPDNSFDVIYAGNLLHHVAIAPALDEIRRVLAPNGVFVSWDPLAHNPLINVYRRMASAVRTEDEHPLKWNELSLFQKRFEDVSWRCFWFSTLAVFLRFYFWERVHPSKERYWKKILVDAERLTPFYHRLECVDDFLLSVAPFLKRYCWNIVICGRKK